MGRGNQPTDGDVDLINVFTEQRQLYTADCTASDNTVGTAMLAAIGVFARNPLDCSEMNSPNEHGSVLRYVT